MIRKFLLLVSVYFMSVMAFSQTVEDARVHMYYHRWVSAEETLKSVIAMDRNSVDAYYWLGELYMQQKKTDAAKDVFQSVYNLAEKNNYSKKEYPLAYAGMAHWKISNGMTDDAFNGVEEILSASKYKNSTALLAAARAHMMSEKGNIDKAIEYLEKAIKRDKKNTDLYITLGDVYRKKRDGANAVISYRDALDYHSADAEAYYKLGKLYKTQKDPEVSMDRFRKSIEADLNFAPSLYELYSYHFYNNDVDDAKKYLDLYIKNSDPSPQHAYMIADYLYLSEKNEKAIDKAKEIIARDGAETAPRIYKMIAYCSEKLGDSVNALKYANKYFEKEKEENYVMKDFELKARLLESVEKNKSAAAMVYEKAFAKAEKPDVKLNYIEKIIRLFSADENKAKEAQWREKLYTTKESPSNLDLYYWGIALYSSENYQKADSVFSIYEEKYPEQVFGYLWRARANAQIDTAMEMGLAIPYYEKMIDVAEKDPENNLANLLGAYGYMGAYKANVAKDFEGSLKCFSRILELDSSNSDAERYIDILKQWIDSAKMEGEDKKEEKKNVSAGKVEKSSTEN